MKVLVGLGNKEEKYKNTKHNIGFLYLDSFLETINAEQKKWEFDNKFKADFLIINLDSEKVMLVKPKTNMNLSGFSVKKIVDYYKIANEDLIIIYDDLSIKKYTTRFKQKGGSGGQNGMKNIIEELSSQNINRIRIGIGYDNNSDWDKWVLSNFTSEELTFFKKTVFPFISLNLINWINNKINTLKLMGELNKTREI